MSTTSTILTFPAVPVGQPRQHPRLLAEIDNLHGMWPQRHVVELSGGAVMLTLPVACGVGVDPLAEPIDLQAVRREAAAVLTCVGANCGVPGLLYRLALAVVALDGKLTSAGAGA